MSTPKLSLWYFKFGGRAEPLRLAAVVGKVPFTNRCIEFEEFGEMRKTGSLPLGQLPLLEVEEEGKEKIIIPQSMSILRYIGKLGGLYPTNPLEAMQVDSILDTLVDSNVLLDISIGGAVRSLISEKEWTDDEKMALRKRIAEKVIPKYCGHVEKILKANESGWLVGDSITIADLVLHSMVSAIKSGRLDGIPTSTLDTFPLILANYEKVEQVPEIVEWNKKHPKPYGTFDFAPN